MSHEPHGKCTGQAGCNEERCEKHQDSARKMICIECMNEQKKQAEELQKEWEDRGQGLSAAAVELRRIILERDEWKQRAEEAEERSKARTEKAILSYAKVEQEKLLVSNERDALAAMVAEMREALDELIEQVPGCGSCDADRHYHCSACGRIGGMMDFCEQDANGNCIEDPRHPPLPEYRIRRAVRKLLNQGLPQAAKIAEARKKVCDAAKHLGPIVVNSDETMKASVEFAEAKEELRKLEGEVSRPNELK